MLIALLVGACAVLLLALGLGIISVRDRETFARRILWLGAFFPFIYLESKTTDDIQAGLSPLDIARGVVPLACLVIALTVSLPRWPRRRQVPELCLAAFLAICLLSSLWSVDARATLLKATLLTAHYVVLATLASYYPDGRRLVDALATALHVVLIGTAFQFLAFPHLAYSGDISAPVPRLHSVIPHVDANPMGLICVVGLVIVVVGVGPRWTLVPGVRGILGLVYIAELAATRTRSALGFGVLVLLYALVRAGRRNSLVVVGLPFLVGLTPMILLMAQAPLADFLGRGQSAQGVATLTGRTTLWGLVITRWQEHPWLGTGFYAGHRLTSLRLPGQGTFRSNVDNTWLEQLLDVGIVGTAFLALFVLAATWRILLRKRGESPEATTFSVAVILYSLSVSLINPTLQQTASNTLVFGFILLGWAPSRNRAAGSQPQRLGKADLSVIGAAGGRGSGVG